MNSDKVNFFYIADVHWGGAAAYACHMVIAFRKMGYDVELLKITSKGEKVTRLFGDNIYHDGTVYSYDNIRYRNISIQDALDLIDNSKYNHICCALYTKKTMNIVDILLDAGCSVMIHSPCEANKSNFAEIAGNFGCKVVVPRTSMVNFAGGHFIPYPYNISIRKGNENSLRGRSYNAMSGARLSQIKSSGILFDVNEMMIDFQLQDGVKKDRTGIIEILDEYAIHLYGSFEKSRTKSLSRKYGYENLPQGIPFFKGNYDLGKGPNIMSKYDYVIDLSNYLVKGITTGSGDISNFAMFEAYDAGSVLVVHKSWLDNGLGLQDGVNCLAVSDANELHDILEYGPYQHIMDPENYVSQRKVYLERFHPPEIIVPKYIEFWESI